MRAALFVVLTLSLFAFADTVFQRIETDNSLTVDQKALYLVYSVAAPEKLPAEYTAGAETDRCGTPAMHEAAMLLDQVSEATLDEVLPLASRPSLSGSPTSFVSPGGHFRVHYTTSGVDACTQSYAEDIAAYMDIAWQTECVTMQWITPPPDNGVGGDDLYDVYVAHLSGGTLGYTSSAGEYKPSDSTHSCSASHIVMGNDLGTSYQKVTTSHEFQHAIQMSYDYEEPTWFMENCAVWMEDQVWDDINDYESYYSVGAMRKPYFGIDAGAMYWYGASYWPRMMQVMYGSQTAVREVWENCAATPGPNMFSAQGEMFAAHGSSFEDGFMKYGLWRYLTGPYYNSAFNLFDDEADDWGTPLVFSWHNFNSFPASGDQGSYAQYLMETLGIAWLKFDLSGYQDGYIEMNFDGRDYFEWDLGVFVYNSSNFEFTWYDCDPNTGELTVSIPTSGWDWAIFFPAFMSTTSLTPNYEFTVEYSSGIGDQESFTGTALSVASNPLSVGSAINFTVPTSGQATISLVDLSGRTVGTLFSGIAEQGMNSVTYQGDLASGTYFMVLNFEGSMRATRVSILR